VPREFTIGELGQRSGVSTSALRFYERKGLISARRTDGNQRRYPTVTLRLVAVIQAGKAAGVPLEEIRAALDGLPAGRAPTKRDWARLSRRWQADIADRILTLQGLQNRLTGCIGCGCLSLRTCGLLNPDDEAGELGPGARYLQRSKDELAAVGARATAAPLR
jgi:MerR family transcriptional regulator, redox-sensitive transcriptional activator SoxR